MLQGGWSIRDFVSEGVFDPEDIKAMSVAMSGVLTDLNLHDKSDQLVRLVAEKIIEHVRDGEHDPERLKAAVLRAFRQ